MTTLPGLAPSGSTVLLMCPDREHRAVLRSWLQQAGYDVMHVSDTQTALLICREYHQPIHALVADLPLAASFECGFSSLALELHPEMQIVRLAADTSDVGKLLAALRQ